MEFKKFATIIFLLAILAGFTNCKKPNDRIFYDRKYVKEIKQAREDLSFYLYTNSIPGVQITIYKDGEIIYSEGMGLASLDLNVPVLKNTKFRIGNITEVFTALAYRIMVENGTLFPDSSIQYYMPDFPLKEHRITLENLNQNVSGIREETSNEVTGMGFNSNLETGLDKFKNDDLLFVPGEFQTNSILSYNLLGAIMEKVKQQKFEKIIKTLVTDSLQLNNTVMDNPFAEIQNRTNFFDLNIIALCSNAITLDLRPNAPSLGLLSNTEDLAEFGNAILHSPKISENIRQELFTPVKLNPGFNADYSNGWKLLTDTWGRKIYGCFGNVRGGGSIMLIFPEEDLVVAAVTNITRYESDIPVYKIASYFLPKTEAQIKYEEQQKEKRTQMNQENETSK